MQDFLIPARACVKNHLAVSARFEYNGIESFIRRSAFMKEIVIVTERLILKPLTTVYLETVNAYALCPDNARYMCYLPYRDSEETLEKLQFFESEWNKDHPDFYEFAVLFNGKHIGGVTLYCEDGAGELAWIIHRDYWGKGFAFEAAKALIDYFSKHGFTRFIATCDTRNVASYRLMEKLGMSRKAELGGRKNRMSEAESSEYLYELIIK